MEGNIISKFNEQPKTKTAWWVMGLGLAALLGFPLLIVFADVARPVVDGSSSNNIGGAISFSSGIVILILAIAALVSGVRAYRKGERSWVLWLGFIPAVLVGVLLGFAIIGEILTAVGVLPAH